MGLINKIKWIKNVKRNDGTDWAYNESYEESNLLLNFSPDHAAGAEKPAVSDVIVLFQTVNASGNQNGGTYLTHLVMVNSPTAYHTGNVGYPMGRGVTVLARTKPIGSLKSDLIDMSFRDVNSGQLCNFNLFNKPVNPNENKKKNNTIIYSLFLSEIQILLTSL